jgi:vancomycin permeability regulator SanA
VERIATAAAAYHHLEGRGGRGSPGAVGILCSGWDERGEATEMATALLAARVDESDIILDGRAARTIDTIDLVAESHPNERIVFVSQRFHIPRVLFLARDHGLDAWGLPAEGDLRGARPRIREAFATHRAIFDRWRRGSKSR